LASFNKDIKTPFNLKKKGLKNIIQNNFHKISNIFNSKNQPIIEENLSSAELDKVFEDINQSCDLIIDDNNIEINVHNYEDECVESDTTLYHEFNNTDDIPYCDNNYRENMKTSSIDDVDKDINEKNTSSNIDHDDIRKSMTEKPSIVKNDNKKSAQIRRKNNDLSLSRFLNYIKN
jgi:hypothetical protein